MSTTAPAPHPTTPELGTASTGSIATGPLLAVGSLFVVEALMSPVVEAHAAYHAVNSPLNAALALACLALWSPLRRGGRIAAGFTVAFAALALIGGTWALAALLAGNSAPDAADGIAHTAVLASFLSMAFLGLAIRRFARMPGVLLAVASFVPVVLVLGLDLDSPWLFLVPELAVGCAWLALARAMRT